ncbi:hypothetical protein Fuma_06242 [Fuerstiella marisgermanici]|uniref:Uncharacterized protein n=1 Tax=Fuerstiella marisgermanici TaxID=1891926 RepID=A0A1P8WR80_9PLAN|nr:hypothetical protein Fuma_06242 [Fuerstiella marisgermanici]
MPHAVSESGAEVLCQVLRLEQKFRYSSHIMQSSQSAKNLHSTAGHTLFSTSIWIANPVFVGSNPTGPSKNDQCFHWSFFFCALVTCDLGGTTKALITTAQPPDSPQLHRIH